MQTADIQQNNIFLRRFKIRRQSQTFQNSKWS